MGVWPSPSPSPRRYYSCSTCTAVLLSTKFSAAVLNLVLNLSCHVFRARAALAVPRARLARSGHVFMHDMI